MSDRHDGWVTSNNKVIMKPLEVAARASRNVPVIVVKGTLAGWVPLVLRKVILQEICGD